MSGSPEPQPAAARHVAVLMGGWSSEREVSLTSGTACALALESRGYRVTRVDVGRDLATVVSALRPDACLNVLHGAFGEDGRVQGLLDVLGIPYTHSGVLASAVAMDKTMAIRLFRQAGIGTPEGYETSLGVLEREGARIDAPFVVKPAAEGSSVGVFILPDGDLRPIFTRNDLDRTKRVRIERQVMDWSERGHEVLGCRGVSRADFRWDPARDEDGLVLLEVNTQPGMTPMSLVPEQAAFRGIGFPDLVVRLVEQARCDN